jgi:Lrp/AsnC family leucine-responsive transcriptional regulator
MAEATNGRYGAADKGANLDGTERTPVFRPAQSQVMRELDDIDRKLVALLQDDDRPALAELSKQIGAAVSTINDRIKRLVNQGVIAGFHARVDPEKLGLELLAFMLVAWIDPKVEPVFLKKIRAASEVLEGHHVTGAWNYLLKVRLKNTKELESFLSGTIKAVRGVERTETMIVLSTAKETWALDAGA